MILVALGSNMRAGKRESPDAVRAALKALETLAEVEATSRLYRSPAWPDPTDPPFTNAVARLGRAPSPEALLAGLHGIEASFGRSRSRANAPRPLDLDLIDYRGMRRAPDDRSGLELPHPRCAERDFVLAPILDVAPDWRHPTLGRSAAELLAMLKHRSAVPM